MLSTRTLGIAMTTLGLFSLSACSSSGTDGQVGQMGIVGPAGPVGPMGSTGPSGFTVFDELDLPGSSYYPESIASAADGTLYVGSFGGQVITKFAPGSNTGMPFVTQLSSGKNVNGVLVDEMDKSLLACANDKANFGTFKPVVKRFNLADGTEKASYDFPAPGACNDLALDGKHNLYVTDSFGVIYKLADGAQTLTSWSTDTKIAPPAGKFGADGISWDGQSNMFVTNFELGTLLRIPIDPTTGAAGAAVAISVTPPLVNPDGMRTIDANTVLIVEGYGRLTRVAITANAGVGTYLSTRLDMPTGVAKVGSNYYVSEGQINRLFSGMQANIPFLVRRVPNF